MVHYQEDAVTLKIPESFVIGVAARAYRDVLRYSYVGGNNAVHEYRLRSADLLALRSLFFGLRSVYLLIRPFTRGNQKLLRQKKCAYGAFPLLAGKHPQGLMERDSALCGANDQTKTLSPDDRQEHKTYRQRNALIRLWNCRSYPDCW